MKRQAKRLLIMDMRFNLAEDSSEPSKRAKG